MILTPNCAVAIDLDEGGRMKIAAYHTVTPERDEPVHRDVYHDLSDCPDGMRIKPANRRAGTEGRPKCDYCRAH